MFNLREFMLSLFGKSSALNFTNKHKKYSGYSIGDFTYGEPTVLDWTRKNKLSIGKYCSISTNVKIMLDGEHDYSRITTYPLDVLVEGKLISENITSKGDVTIGNDVWIGSGSMVLSGVTIGDGAVLAAQSVVTKDVEPYSIVAGNPARHIKFRFDAVKREQISALEWWNIDSGLLYEFWKRGINLMDSKSLLSVVLVIYNEERHLSKCLASIKDIAGEIIVVHDGECTDKSKEIAEQFHAKFYERPRIGIAEGHRIFSIEQSTKDWVLILDADEMISPELARVMPLLLSSKNFDAYEFTWPLYDGEKVICDDWPRKKALFRKNKLRYIDFPQAEFTTNGVICNTNFVLMHQPTYNNFTLHRFKEKWVNWAKIHAEKLYLDFSKIPKVGYDENENWSNFFILKRKYPEFFLLYGCIEAIKSLKSGGLRNIYSFKASLMWGGYNFLVYYYAAMKKWTQKL